MDGISFKRPAFSASAYACRSVPPTTQYTEGTSHARANSLGYGNEEIALQALREGAASYVPKKSLESDLASTLEKVAKNELRKLLE